MQRKVETFDLEQAYDEKITPLMDQIIEICQEHKMPMIADFIYCVNDQGLLSGCETLLNGFENRRIDTMDGAHNALRAPARLTAWMDPPRNSGDGRG